MPIRPVIHIIHTLKLGRPALTVLAGLFIIVSGAEGRADSRNDVQSAVIEGQTAPLFRNLGHHQVPVSTTSPRAQLFFNQGMMLVYGFNHAEAQRSFREAARLDPEFAMAYWGMALVLGPNINMPMPPEAGPQAYALIQRAAALKAAASEKERGYIDALAQRYAAEAAPDRTAHDRAYAEAMGALHERYPDDLDLAVLYAESLMDLRPWDYWTRDGQPYPETQSIMAVLESVLARQPNHPGALHLYIHAVEYARPELAEAAADRLGPLAPGAGHLVHMPSHIFRRVGRYAQASQSNLDAIAADENYITMCQAQGVYPLAYYPHNIHFLWDSATMQGRRQVALDAARKAAASIPEGAWREVPLLHQFLVAPLFADVRFGEWDHILATPPPPEGSLFWNGVWHYARGMAFTAERELEAAEQELARLNAIASDPSLKDLRVTFSLNGAKPILAIAVEVLAGELAAKRGDYPEAVARLNRGVLLEENLIYNEPPDWHVPVRQALGAVLLEAGRADEAEAVYWQDLKGNRENGWALFGLMQSLHAQGKQTEADQIARRYQEAWRHADIQLAASRFMGAAPVALSAVRRN